MRARGAVDWASQDRFRRNGWEARAPKMFPAAWLPKLRALADARAWRERRGFRPSDGEACREWERWAAEYGGALFADLSDSQIRARALEASNEARGLELGIDGEPWREWGRIVDFCRSRGVEPPSVALRLKGITARVRCPYWWRRALRRMVAQRVEGGALRLGIVSRAGHQPYASDAAVLRRLAQLRNTQEVLARAAMENELGMRATLADLVARSPANKAIRRGELMTRIRGCEEWADDAGMSGVFLTLTCPSRFHSTLRTGRRNPKYSGDTPAQAQAWLCRQWARARAALHRRGLTCFGFRIAEPHHDGCPHWHLLLWFRDDAARDDAMAIIRAYWLRDDGGEPGAERYRVHWVAMERGGAAAYVAKYVSKNIDDKAIGGHLDDYADGAIGPDLLGDLEVRPCVRVDAWAATWRIRQFQAIGQPPVSVWRELRRVGEGTARAAGGSMGAFFRLWHSAQRVGDVRADWRRYMAAQGGPMRGRRCLWVLARDRREGGGMYPDAVRFVPVGVRVNLPGSVPVASGRALWRAVLPGEGEPVARSARPRTCVHNCTRPGWHRAGPLADGQAQRARAGVDAAQFWTVERAPDGPQALHGGNG